MTLSRCPQFLRDTLDAIGEDGQMVVTIGCGFVNTMLLVSDKLTGDQYVTLTMATVATFITGRTVATFSSKTKDGATP